MTQNGKIEKRSLRVRGVTRTTWDRERAEDGMNSATS